MAIKVNNAGTLKTIGGVALTGFTIDGIEMHSDTITNTGIWNFTVNKKLSSYKYMVVIVSSIVAVNSGRGITSFHAVNMSYLLPKVTGNLTTNKKYNLYLYTASNANHYDLIVNFQDVTSPGNTYKIPFSLSGTTEAKLDVFMIY